MARERQECRPIAISKLNGKSDHAEAFHCSHLVASDLVRDTSFGSSFYRSHVSRRPLWKQHMYRGGVDTLVMMLDDERDCFLPQRASCGSMTG